MSQGRQSYHLRSIEGITCTEYGDEGLGKELEFFGGNDTANDKSKPHRSKEKPQGNVLGNRLVIPQTTTLKGTDIPLRLK